MRVPKKLTFGFLVFCAVLLVLAGIALLRTGAEPLGFDDRMPHAPGEQMRPETEAIN